MKKTGFILSILFALLQTSQAQKLLVEDLDGDRKKDKIYIDDSIRVVCELSSNKYRKIIGPEVYCDFGGNLLTSGQGCFSVQFNNMRSGGADTYCYDKQSKKIRLASSYEYAFGNAANDGSGEYSIDYLTGEYSEHHCFYDMIRDTLFCFDMEAVMNIPPIYFEGTNIAVFEGERYSLYKTHRNLKEEEIDKTLPRTTKELTQEDIDLGEWNLKISETDTLENFVLKIVTSRSNYDRVSLTPQAYIQSIQVFEKKSGIFVQEIMIDDYEVSWESKRIFHLYYPDMKWEEYDTAEDEKKILRGDYNNDNWQDFSLRDYYDDEKDETITIIFLYDPKKQIFVKGGF